MALFFWKTEASGGVHTWSVNRRPWQRPPEVIVGEARHRPAIGVYFGSTLQGAGLPPWLVGVLTFRFVPLTSNHNHPIHKPKGGAEGSCNPPYYSEQPSNRRMRRDKLNDI